MYYAIGHKNTCTVYLEPAAAAKIKTFAQPICVLILYKYKKTKRKNVLNTSTLQMNLTNS